MFTVGILAALRSKKLEGRIIGVMVTASHNPEEVSLLTTKLRLNLHSFNRLTFPIDCLVG
jgi:hypothetical protein